jgi:ferredoxin
VTGPITHPNGTFGPIYVLPSIKDDDGNIKDPVQDQEKLTYSPCVGDGSCSPSARFVSSARKGKFAPIEVGSDEDQQVEQSQAAADAAPRMALKHVQHVDKVEMQDAEISDEGDSDSDANESDSSESSDNDNQDSSDNSKDSTDKDSDDSDEEDTVDIETASRIVKGPDADGQFTPTYSDDDTSSPSAQQQSPQSTESPAASDSSVDQARFTQTKRSVTHSMSGGKPATGAADSSMEVTEYDDTVVGGKRIEQDQDSQPIKEEADDKQ